MDESPADWIKSLLTRVAHVKVVVLCGGQFDRSRWREHVEFEAPHIPASVDCRHPKDCGGALQLRRLVEQAVEAGAPEQSCDVDCPGYVRTGRKRRGPIAKWSPDVRRCGNGWSVHVLITPRD